MLDQYAFPTILFAPDRDNLSPEMASTLQGVSQQLATCPDKKIRIDAHADDTGTRSYNAHLSTRRAQTVKDFLVAHGVDSKRLLVQGYGDMKPVGDNLTEAGRAKNRRVTLIPF